MTGLPVPVVLVAAQPVVPNLLMKYVADANPQPLTINTGGQSITGSWTIPTTVTGTSTANYVSAATVR